MTNGVIYIAIGPKAQTEAAKSIETLKQHNDLPVTVIDRHPNPGNGARRAKLEIDELSPYDHTLYIDADTRIKASLSPGFSILADGWDMAIAPSTRQGQDVLGHLPEGDKLMTLEALACNEPLGLQAGLFFFRKSPGVRQLFAAWRKQWQAFEDQDQGALLRALKQVPVKMWLLSWAWNSQRGEMVEHLFGRCR